MNDSQSLVSMRNRAALATSLQALSQHPDRFPAVLFEALLAEMMAMYGGVTIVQIGAYVGRSVNDPVYPFITKYFRENNPATHSLAVLVEPVQHLFSQLVENYAGCNGVKLEKAAICDISGTKDFYHLKEGVDLQKLGLPNMFEQLGSFLPERIAEWDVHHGDPKIQQFIKTNTVMETVKCLTFHDLLKKHDVRSVDLLAIDVEGYEFEILSSIDFASVRPKFIFFESSLLGEKKIACEELLAQSSYTLLDIDVDTLAILDFLDPQRLPKIQLG